MKKILAAFAISAIFMSCGGEKKEAAEEAQKTPAAPAEEVKKTAPAELLDMSMADPVKKGIEAFASGDIDAMTANFADNIRYTWSSGDSLIGKQAVKDYYKMRRSLIDSASYSDFIFLPVKVNQVQSPYAPAGNWVLSWAFAHIKYKNGKKVNFWLHNVYHYNDAGKVDLASQYIDRAPINEATKGLVKK